MFEFLVLESFQAGLSWEIILNKRPNFRTAFDDFNAEAIANYSSAEIAHLLNNKGIIRNKLKIEATINNAQRFLEIKARQGSFCDFLWGFVDGQTIQNSFKSLEEVPAKTALSDKISKALKKEGFKFLGSTVVYAHMQAVGMVNDHITDCFRYQEVKKA